MQKVLDFLLKIFIIACVFLSPLFFFMDFTQNPFLIQNFILVVASFGALFIVSFQLYKQQNPSFLYSKADLGVLIFIGIAIISLGVNTLTSSTPQALLNEFWRRGHMLLTGLFSGSFLMRLILNKVSYEQKENHPQTKDNYKLGFLLLSWGLLWLPFGYFRMQGIIDIYGLLVWVCGFYIALKILKEISAKNILDILLAVCALACAYGICQNLGLEFLWNVKIGDEFGSRSISTLGNPNFLSAFILFALPFAVIYFLRAKEKLAQFYYCLLCVLFAICMALTQTRSSWIGAFCAVIILLCSKNFRELLLKNKTKFILLVISAGSLFFFWPQYNTEGYKSLVLQRATTESSLKSGKWALNVEEQDINQSYHQRLMMWTCGVENLKEKPFLGWGWGSWQLTFAPCQGRILLKYPALKGLKTQANAAHNIFVETASQSGLIGLFAYLFLLFLVFAGFKKYYKSQTDIDNKLFYLALFASLVAFLADNFFNITLQVPVLCFIFYFNLGILASLEVNKATLQKSKVFLWLILVAFLFIFFGVKNFKNLLSASYNFKAHKQRNMYQMKNLFEKGYQLSTEYPEDTFALIRTCLNIGDFDRMAVLLNEAITYYPYYYEFYYNKAALEFSRGRAKEAFSYVKKTLELYPVYDLAFNLVLDLLNKNPELRTLDNVRFLEGFPIPLSFQNAYQLLFARIYFKHGNYQKAREILLKELSKNQFDENVQQELSVVNEKLGIKEDLVLQKAKKLTALRKQVISSEKINKNLFEEIKKAAREDELEGQMLLAQAYFKIKDYSSSREILQELYKKYSDFLPLNFALASLEEASANKAEAEKYLKVILLKDSKNQLALRRLQALN